jgi:hypothetical protein
MSGQPAPPPNPEADHLVTRIEQSGRGGPMALSDPYPGRYRRITDADR